MNKVIYCFWTGDNPMSEARLKGLESMKNTTQVKIVLVTPSNLSSYVLEDHPLHPAYEYLNPTHRSDYLCSYFMNFYGGGYSDIKTATSSWLDAFNKLDISDNYILGYKEIGPRGVAYVRNDLYKTLVSNWEKLVGCGCFICKPHTPFTEEWYAQKAERMNVRQDELIKRGDMLEWTELKGHIFHPLCYKYADKVMQDNSVIFNLSVPYR